MILNNRGFMLLEIIMVVLMVGLTVGLIYNIPPTLNLISVSNRYNLAKSIASSQMENLRLKGFENLGSNGTFVVTDSRLSKLPSSTGEILIEDCPGEICSNGESDIKKVTVSIRWQEAIQTKKLDLVTLVSSGGLK